MKILVEGIRLYAYHGCMEEEAKTGRSYRVDVNAETDQERSAESDRLEDTVNYVSIYNIVKEEMAVRSKLIEHVAARIARRIRVQHPPVKKVTVKVTKLHPPIDGTVEGVSVILTR